jgi:hypothetical protein
MVSNILETRGGGGNKKQIAVVVKQMKRYKGERTKGEAE